MLGYDIVFATTDDTQIEHEIEHYDPTTGELVAWVKLPKLYANNTTNLKMYFGNVGLANAVNNPSSKNVFSSVYESVWHMSNGLSGVLLSDATGNNDAQGFGGLGLIDMVSGKIGMAIDFDGLKITIL
ncbi:MAG: DUF2341 domain-containing protein [Vicingus serpentipes]|nr:DUF2341 domain-containing protein [Vicingus serpentipes]